MGRGGPRRAPDPRSARSDKRGVRFGKLPAEGYTGRLPTWPLTKASAREREVWRQVWRTPQAAAWATEPWRHRTVAMFVRLSVRCEDPDAPAALHAVSIRYADQIGLTPTGLRENRWEVEELAAPVAAVPVPERGAMPSRALVSVERGGGPALARALPLRDRLTVREPGAS